MIFHSLQYILFFVVVLAVYWVLRRRAQNWFLLLASYYFYGCVHPAWLGLLALTSITDFSCARLIALRPEQRKRWLALSLMVNFTILGVFKYFDFFTTSVASLLEGFGWTVSPAVLGLVLPAGISFYTFQSASYVVDVYRGQVTARRRLPDYLLFVSFFPQLVAGPIERAGHLLVQVEKPRTFDARAARGAVLLILWGFFKKLVIADNAALVVAKVFSLDEPSFPVLWAGVFAFGVQIYADFSAYTDIARGCARLLGFDLCRNFNHPWLAESPQDFWRRWHISLSTWFRDYVYFPLGGNRGSLARHCRNLMLTFLLSGLWHGAAWNFVLWGSWHGLLLVLWTLWSRAPASVGPGRIPRWGRIGLTFVLVHVGWLMFREQSFSHLLRHFTLNPFEANATEWRMALFFVAQTLIHALPLYIHPLLDRWLTRHGEAAAAHFPGWRWTAAITALALLLYLGLILLRSPATSDFIYFQF